jgi:hypothetical protein
MSRLDEEFDIVRETDFFLAITTLKVGLIDAIFGPQGGIFILDDRECLVYHRPHSKYRGIYLSVDNIMSFHWKWLIDRFKRAVDVTPLKKLLNLLRILPIRQVRVKAWMIRFQIFVTIVLLVGVQAHVMNIQDYLMRIVKRKRHLKKDLEQWSLIQMVNPI